MSSEVVLLVVIGVVALALILWFLAASRRARVELAPSAEDEPVRRNQALIDAPPVVAPAPVTMMPDLPALVPADSDIAAPAAKLEPALPEGDDLTMIKGVGPKLAESLRTLGVTSYAQIAAWDDAEIGRIDAQLGRFQGRIRRDNWPAQAQLLVAGDTAAYEAKFGRL